MQGRRKRICFRGAEINDLILIMFMTLKLDFINTVGASGRSQNEHTMDGVIKLCPPQMPPHILQQCYVGAILHPLLVGTVLLHHSLGL